jgi:WD40 repeat protein
MNEKRPEISVTGDPTDLQFSSDGQLIAVNIRGISVWEVESGQKKYELPDGRKAEQPIRFDHILSFDNENRLWCLAKTRMPSQRQIVRFNADGKSSEPIITIPDSARVKLSSDNSLAAVLPGPAEDGPEAIEVWDLKSRKVIKRFDGHWERIRQLAFSPDNKWLASTAHNGGVIKFWSLENGPTK